MEITIKTDGDCDAFADWFRSQGNFVEKVPWHTHRWHVYFAPLSTGSADLTIRHICQGITNWPEAVQKQWEAAAVREFLVGYEIGTEPVALLDHFDASTLNLVARFGAGIGIALYPATLEGSHDSSNEDANRAES